MTSKEAEHWLIDNDFNWDAEFRVWRYKKFNIPQIAEEFIKDDPAKSIKFAKDSVRILQGIQINDKH